MVGAVPDRHRAAVDGRRRWTATSPWRAARQDVAPLEMTKWFDTNYHYLVPELGPDTVFAADSAKQVAELPEALALGLAARPVLVGPGHLPAARPSPRPASPPDFEPLTLLDRLLPVYAEVLADLRGRRGRVGAARRARPRPGPHAGRAERRRPRLPRPRRRSPTGPKLLVASLLRPARRRPARAGQGARSTASALDFTGPAAAQPGRPGRRRRTAAASAWSPAWSTAATSGSTTCEQSLATLGTLLGLAGRVDVAASCSLLHVPLDLAAERDLDPRGRAAGSPSPARRPPRSSPSPGAWPTAPTPSPPNSPPTAPTLASRASSAAHPRPGRARPRRRRRPTPTRRRAQPPTPSAPQPSGPGSACRRCRRPPSARSRRPPSCARPAPTCAPAGSTTAGYDGAHARPRSREVIAFQEKAGLDVLVHGEPERNDMVQYFAEQLDRLPRHRSTAGSSPTAPATCARRSSPATSPGPSR